MAKKKYKKVSKKILKKPPPSPSEEEVGMLVKAAGNGDIQSANILFTALEGTETGIRLFNNEGKVSLSEITAAIKLNDKVDVSFFHRPTGSFDGGQMSGININYKF